MGDPLDQLLKELDLGDIPAPAGGNKANTGAKKAGAARAETKDGSKKVKTPIETTYEGYILRPVSPQPGEKRSFTKVKKTTMPFDSLKIFNLANAHRTKSGRDGAASFRNLTATQQELVERVVQEKMRDEKNVDAMWEPYDIRRNKKEVKTSMFRVEQIDSHLELTVRRKDKYKGLVTDKPTGNTVTPVSVQGEVIDLSRPMKAKKVETKAKGQGQAAKAARAESDDDIVEVVDMGKSGAGRAHNNGHQQEQQAHDDRYFWNGTFWEEREDQGVVADGHGQHQPHHHGQQPQWHQHQQQQWQQQQQAQHHQQNPHWQAQQHWQQGQQHPAVPPSAPMPGYEPNPFQPIGRHPEQYVDMPPTIDARAHYEPQPHYDARSRSRSHSRRRHPQQTRRRSHHQYTPSISSSEADWQDYTPPSTPPREEFMSAGSLHRNKSQRYYREDRSRYRDERGEVRPAISYRFHDVEERPVPRAHRPVVIHDDYPGSRRRLTDYPEAFESADFRQRRDAGYDMLREDARDRRREHRHYLPRRNTGVW